MRDASLSSASRPSSPSNVGVTPRRVPSARARSATRGASVPATFTTTSTTPSATENWNVAPFVQAAATASAPNWTLVLSNSSETSANYWVAFSAAPTISITYDYPPLAPSAPLMKCTWLPALPTESPVRST